MQLILKIFYIFFLLITFAIGKNLALAEGKFDRYDLDIFAAPTDQERRAKFAEFIAKKTKSDFGTTFNYHDRSISIQSIRPVLEQLTFKKDKTGSFHIRLEDFLDRLYQKFPTLFQYPVANFISKSLQGASLEEPRVTVVSPDGRLLMCFNGSYHQRGGNRVEFIQFHDENEQTFMHYTYHEIVFGRNRIPSIRKMHFDRTCADCHSTRPDAVSFDEVLRYMRPLFDPYNAWPRYFGDFLSEPRSDLTDEAPNVAKKLRAMKRFIEKAPNHPRYKYLNFSDPREGDPMFEFFRNFADMNMEGFIEIKKFRPPLTNNLFHLNEILTFQAVLRIDQQMKKSKYYDMWKYPLMYAHTILSPTSGFTQETKLREIERTLGGTQEKTNSQWFEKIIEKHIAIDRRAEERDQEVRNTARKTLVENLFLEPNLAKDVSDFGYSVTRTILYFLSVDLRDYSTSTTRNHVLVESENLLELTLGDRFNFYFAGEDVQSLDDIVDRSNIALAGFQPNSLNLKPYEERVLAGKTIYKQDCFGCHVSGQKLLETYTFQKWIEQDRFMQKVKYRIDEEKPTRRMPHFYAPLSMNEKENLLNFFKQHL